MIQRKSRNQKCFWNCLNDTIFVLTTSLNHWFRCWIQKRRCRRGSPHLPRSQRVSTKWSKNYVVSGSECLNTCKLPVSIWNNLWFMDVYGLFMDVVTIVTVTFFLFDRCLLVVLTCFGRPKKKSEPSDEYNFGWFTESLASKHKDEINMDRILLYHCFLDGSMLFT